MRRALLLGCVLASAACGGQSGGEEPATSSSASTTGSGSGAGGAGGSSSGAGGGDASALDARVTADLEAAHIPGLSACIVKGGAVAACRTYGFADLEANRAMDQDSVFLIASVSKTVTATALMQVFETGAFALDDGVAGALDFGVAHPAFPTPITYRMLLTHTASIRDDWDTLDLFYDQGVDPTKTLHEVVSGYFDPAGAYYSATGNFTQSQPGTTYEYANMGFALAGSLVEALTGTDFAAFTKQHVFTPLAMNRSSWWLADFAPADLVMPYAWEGGAFVPYGQYSFADYPDGGLRTTAPDLARFLAALTQGGVLEGQRILAESTVAEMLTVQDPAVEPTQGLCFYHVTLNGEDWVGHNGGESGVATDMYFRPSDGLGLVVLMNGDWPEDPSPIDDAELALIAYGESL